MKKFCKSPWERINFNNHGIVKPCCVFLQGKKPSVDVEDIFKWFIKTYKDVKDMNSIKHSGCLQCLLKENKGTLSRRRLMNDFKYPTHFIESEAVNFNFLDISFGNECNLSCRMCESRNSNKWISKEKILVAGGLDRLISEKFSLSKNIVNQLINYCNDNKETEMIVEIKGGEPFIQSSFLNFLKSTGDKFKGKTTLKIFTNGSVMPDSYLNEIVKFKKKYISFSVETANPSLYKFIRGGNITSIDTVIKNIEKVKSFDVIPKLCITISMDNIFYLSEFRDWVIEMDFKTDPSLWNNTALYPTYFNPGILPEKEKQIIYNMYKNTTDFKFVINHLKNTKSDPEQVELYKKFNKLLGSYETNQNRTFKQEI